MPQRPIWVVCAESHYTVLFGVTIDVLRDESFDLFWYDELAKQEDPIRLTVSQTDHAVETDGDLVPLIDDVIRTKWRTAQIDWNGADPVL